MTRDETSLQPLAFAPDGKSMTFAVRDADGRPHLEIMNLELRSVYRPIGLIDDDGATQALRGTAAELGAGHPEILAQEVVH